MKTCVVRHIACIALIDVLRPQALRNPAELAARLCPADGDVLSFAQLAGATVTLGAVGLLNSSASHVGKDGSDA